MNVEHLVEKYELNDLETQIIQYLKDNFYRIRDVSIRELMKETYTSNGNVYKLCRKLGFSGYSEMIYSFANISEVQVSALKNIEQYLSPFGQLLTKYKDKKIIIFGLGYSSSIADYMQQRLTIHGYSCMSVVHTEMLDKMHQDDCLFIVISHSAKTPRLVELVENAHKNRIDIMSFSSNQNSTLYDYSTVFIQLGQYNAFLNSQQLPNTFFGEVLLAFESLLYSYLSSTTEYITD